MPAQRVSCACRVLHAADFVRVPDLHSGVLLLDSSTAEPGIIARTCVQVMFCIIYVYAVTGLAFYGGLVTKDPKNKHYEKLASMDYGKNDYWLLNFNDMPSGMVLMVQLLAVNNWMVFTEAYAAVGGASAWIIFISFYGVGVIAGELALSSQASCTAHLCVSASRIRHKQHATARCSVQA
jgi:hypothetical protein